MKRSFVDSSNIFADLLHHVLGSPLFPLGIHEVPLVNNQYNSSTFFLHHLNKTQIHILECFESINDNQHDVTVLYGTCGPFVDELLQLGLEMGVGFKSCSIHESELDPVVQEVSPNWVSGCMRGAADSHSVPVQQLVHE